MKRFLMILSLSLISLSAVAENYYCYINYKKQGLLSSVFGSGMDQKGVIYDVNSQQEADAALVNYCQRLFPEWSDDCFISAQSSRWANNVYLKCSYLGEISPSARLQPILPGQERH